MTVYRVVHSLMPLPCISPPSSMIVYRAEGSRRVQQRANWSWEGVEWVSKQVSLLGRAGAWPLTSLLLVD